MNPSLKTQVESQLPPRVPIRLQGEADFYGISHQIASQQGYSCVPRCHVGWQHGWVVDPVTDIRQVIGDHSKEQTILVANESIAKFLLTQGVKAIPVGLPLIYSDPNAVARIPNSLLVMPPHVTKHSGNSFQESDYVDFISEHAKHFEHVLICLSQQCIDRGFWVDSFARQGFCSIAGAGVDDKHALNRMTSLLMQFEVVTSNASGSHLLYAGYCGCAVSVSGPEHSIAKSDLINEPFYQQHPDLVDLMIDRTTRRSLFHHSPHFDQLPTTSTPCQDWANQTIGLPCKQSSADIADLLGWTLWERVRASTKQVIRKKLVRRTI